jgi:hypothetical protein
VGGSFEHSNRTFRFYKRRGTSKLDARLISSQEGHSQRNLIDIVKMRKFLRLSLIFKTISSIMTMLYF